MPKTPFWRARLESLPAPLRHRYEYHFDRMERWERALDRVVTIWTRLTARRRRASGMQRAL